MTVRSHVPWQWYAGRWLHWSSVAAAVWLVAQRGEKAGLSQEIGVLELKLRRRSCRYCAAVGTEQSGMQMEGRSANSSFPGSRVGSGKCQSQEEIAFFERLVPPVGVESGQSGSSGCRSVEKSPGIPIGIDLIGFVPVQAVQRIQGKLKIVVSYALAGKDPGPHVAGARSGNCRPRCGSSKLPA